MTPEARILHDIRLGLGTSPGVVLWRNNTGALVDATGRLVRYGLCEGSADLIGMVQPYPGARALFVGLEVKAPSGRVRPEQREWLECVERGGGTAAVVRSVEEAMAVIERMRG